MCTVTLNINEAQVRKVNPSLTDKASINRWAQRLMDNLIDSLIATGNGSVEPYTIEEIHTMIDKSDRQIAAGQYQDFDKAMDEIEAELTREDELEMSEAV
jgi:hypothetical protein